MKAGISDQRGPTWRTIYARGSPYVKYGFLLLALVFLVVFVYRQWNAIQQLQFQFVPGLLALSVVFGLVGIAVGAVIWYMLLCFTPHRLPYRVLLSAYGVSNLIKYIPGVIWSYATLAYAIEKRGVPRSMALSSISLWVMVMIGTGLAASLPLLNLITANQQWLAAYVILLALVIVGLLAFHSERAWGLINALLRRMGRAEVAAAEFPPRGLIGAMFAGLGMWACFGIGFFLFCASLFPLNSQDLFFFGAAFAFAWIVGFVTPFSPAGLGMREGVLTVLLVPVLSPSAAVVVALLSRLWLVGADILMAGIAGLLIGAGRRAENDARDLSEQE